MRVLCAIFLIAAGLLSAQSSETSEPTGPPPEVPSEEADSEAPVVDLDASRTDLNLLGAVDAQSGEARRNENVQIDLIDNNVLKEMNKRVGVTATIVDEFHPRSDYFGAEFGGSPTSPSAIPYVAGRAIHGSIFETHDNSIFRARSFFQVGDVQPARTNEYGFDVTLPVWRGASFLINGQQTRSRGQVNGNVLVPKADERTALATDPETRIKVQAMLDKFPAEAPNRTDINERALNTNAPQFIDNDVLGGTLYQSLGERDKLTLRYAFTSQNVQAFQLIAGQNPDSRTKNHDARMTWTRSWSPSMETDLTAGFDRVGSILKADESAFGPTVMFSGVFNDLGPGANIPIDRAVNVFRYAANARKVYTRHSITAGAEVWRRQVNGDESNANRGQFSFRNDFGNTAIENIRLGLASTFIGTIGNTNRGFRQWDMQYYVGDEWRLHPKLSLNMGVRYVPVTAPTEIHGQANLGYHCDCNNVAPRFGFAWRPSDKWGVIRAAYGVQYGDIAPVTYSASRFNAPYSNRIRVPAPDFLHPLGLTTPEVDPNGRGTYFDFSPDLVMPYEHQYNFSWERPVYRDWRLNLGYVGSRAMKIVTLWYFNRAEVVPGIPQITATQNDRRADKRYFDVRRSLNGAQAYYDAAKVTLLSPVRNGFSLETSYWFSKAIDLGANYTSTASGADALAGRGQDQYDVHSDMKGVSDFDQPHSWMTRITWRSPGLQRQPRWLRSMFGGWEAFAVTLVKTGTPFTVQSGSDAPGYGNLDGSGSDRPNIVDPSILGRKVKHPDTSAARLPRSAFSFIQPTDIRGNIGRNTFRRDGIQNINAALSRTWTVASEARLTFRAESNNVLNRPQFAEPGFQLTSPNFGQITNTLNDGRSFRFTARLAF
ncbi:MAG: hypothetical protein R2724_02175 [Bryobacterales bacterium]